MKIYSIAETMTLTQNDINKLPIVERKILGTIIRPVRKDEQNEYKSKINHKVKRERDEKIMVGIIKS